MTIIETHIAGCSVRLKIPEATSPETMETLTRLLAEALLNQLKRGETQ